MPRKYYTKKRRSYGKKRVSRTGAGVNPFGLKAGPKMFVNAGRKSRVPIAARKDLTYWNPPMGSIGYMPRSMSTQHRYCEEISLTTDNTTGLTGSEYVFRLNSLFDPNETGAGHQPRGFDQMAEIYKRYCVWKVDVNVKVTGVSTASLYIGMRYSSNNNITYSVGNLKYQNELLEQENTAVIDGFVGNQINLLGLHIADIQGAKRNSIFDDVLYSAAPTANPAAVCRFGVAVGSSDLTTGATAKVCVTFVYHTLWTERFQVAQS